MDWIKPLTDWAKANDTVLWWMFACSLAIFLLTPAAVAWTVVRLPADYFSRKERKPLESWQSHPVTRAMLLVLKNLLGVVLLLAGLAMLLMPGQGLLTLVVGLILIDFPGKFRFERWLAFRKPVWRSINWLRKRAGREAFHPPSPIGRGPGLP